MKECSLKHVFTNLSLSPESPDSKAEKEFLWPFSDQWHRRTAQKGGRINPCEMVYHCSHAQYRFCHSCLPLPSSEPKQFIPRNIWVCNQHSPEVIPQQPHAFLCAPRGKRRGNKKGGGRVLKKKKKKPLQASGLNCDLLQSTVLSIITNPIIPDRLTQL